MNRNIIRVGMAALCLVGGFLPLATAGACYVNIHHIGGMSWLLYPLALLAVVLGRTSVYKPDLPFLRLWLGVIALSGLVLTALTVSAAISQVEYFANSMGRLSFLSVSREAAAQVSAGIGSGGMMAAVGYLCLLLLNLVPARAVSDREGGER